MRKYARVILPWSYPTLSQMPDEISGVYAFWCRDNGKCIYVGKARDRSIRERLKTHWRGSHNEILGLWIQVFGDTLDVCYISMDTNKIDTLERRLIKAWKPEANKQHSQR